MAIEIEKSCFNGLSGAMSDLSTHKLWPTTYCTNQATAAEPHWHSEDVCGYVIAGNFNILDTDGQKHDLVPGDKFKVPAKTIHAEGEINSPVTLIIGISEPLSADRFLLPRNASTL